MNVNTRNVSARSSSSDSQFAKCPLCGTFEFGHLGQVSDERVGEGPADIVQCTHCKLAWLDVPLSLEKQADCYDVYYTDSGYYDSRNVAYEQWYMAQIENMSVRPGRMLDVGCGPGHLMLTASERGWTVQGCDVSAIACGVARQNGLSVFNGIVEDGPWNADDIDVVNLGQVLEHLQDPFGTVTYITKLLRPGGLFVCGTPNIESLNAKLYKDRWSFFEGDHFWYFGSISLRQLCTLNGLHTERLSGRGTQPLRVRLHTRWKRWHRRKAQIGVLRATKDLFVAVRTDMTAFVGELIGMPDGLIVYARKSDEGQKRNRTCLTNIQKIVANDY